MAQLFDSSEYLGANPDVANAVAQGRAASPWRHFVQCGYGEGRPGVPDAVRRKVGVVMAEPARVPPAWLISKVHGDGDAFEQAGRAEALDIYGAVNDRISLEHPLRILDFGCGCARVLRFMGELAPESRFHASDSDGEAVSWCLENYAEEVRRGRYTFVRHGAIPPAPLKSDYFDLIYATSVFTRLPEDLEHRWLAELRRIAKPDGLLVLSTRGEALIRGRLSAEDRKALGDRGFLHFGRGSPEVPPGHDQAAWHARAYVDRVWSRYFHIVGHVPAGMAGRQDLVLCAKPRHTVV
jgi:SAM-dependent methyltransferase